MNTNPVTLYIFSTAFITKEDMVWLLSTCDKEHMSSQSYDSIIDRAYRGIHLIETFDKVDWFYSLDNGQIHKKEETIKIIKDSGNHLLYTCPYHPRLNCIEQFFNQMKHYMKLYESKNYNELKENVKKSITNIKEENYKNYFIYAYNKEHYKTKKNSSKKNSSKKSSSKHKIYK